MILRLLFASACSLLLLGMMPFLNKARASKEKEIVSYRLHSFEAKLTPPPLPEPEPEIVEKKIEKAVEVLTTIPKPAMSQTSQSMPRIVANELSFSSGAFVGTFSSTDSIVDGKTLVSAGAEMPDFQTDGADHLLYGPKPVIPLRARQLGLSGIITAQWDVNEFGQVENVRIIKSSNSIFDKGVLQALKQYRFKPYVDNNGKSIRMSLKKEFQIEVH